MGKVANMNRKGFTLIEVIVVAAIIAILAGILVPMIFNQIDESKKAKAQGDIKSISSAIQLFRKDTGLWPNRTDGFNPATNTVLALRSDGNTIATPLDWSVDPVTNKMLIDYVGGSVDTTLTPPVNGRGYSAPPWKGPYITSINADPWGNTYLVGAKNFENNTGLPVWIISAGPDGIIQTSIDSASCFDGSTADLLGDDICYRLK